MPPEPVPPDPVHPDLRAVARVLPRAIVGPRTLRPLRVLSALQGRLPARGVHVDRVGPLSVRVHRPPGDERRAEEPPGHDRALPGVLWIHGGGYVIGAAAQDDAVCRHLARALPAVVVAVDYRLAPEHPFPEPLDDCARVLTWLATQPSVDPTRLAVAGASAGGGLAAALALRWRDGDGPPLRFQLLSYPMLDDRTAARTNVDERGFRLWNGAANRFGWAAYTGRAPGAPGMPDHAAPARCADLRGLPPAWIGVGTLDLFHDEDVAYAQRLRAAGVACQLDVVAGAFHGFDAVAPRAAVTRAYRHAQVGALAAALAP